MGSRIGVALSGGGARGLAHLGVLQVIEDHDIPVHAVAGTSMGGLIAGLYAAGISVQELIEFTARVGIIDVAAPDRNWRGLFGHRKLERLLIEVLGSDQMMFADLEIPAAVVAADIESGEMVILNQGPIIPALTATCAFPMLFSPVRYSGRWLVDGGVVNNFPVDIVRTMPVDRVIGVSVPAGLTLREETERPSEDGRRGLSFRNLRRFTPQTPDWRTPFLIAETSMGLAIQLVNQRRLALCPPDLLIQVPVQNVGLFDNGNSKQVIEAGRKAALADIQGMERMASSGGAPGSIAKLISFLGRLREAWNVLRRPGHHVYPARFCCPSVGTDRTGGVVSSVSERRGAPQPPARGVEERG